MRKSSSSDPTRQLKLIPIESRVTCNRADVDTVQVHSHSGQLRPSHDQPVLLAERIHRLLRFRVQVRKRNNSRRKVLCWSLLRLKHPTSIQILADISARARSKKNKSVGAVRPVDRASMLRALSTQGQKVQFTLPMLKALTLVQKKTSIFLGYKRNTDI